MYEYKKAHKTCSKASGYTNTFGWHAYACEEVFTKIAPKIAKLFLKIKYNYIVCIVSYDNYCKKKW